MNCRKVQQEQPHRKLHPPWVCHHRAGCSRSHCPQSLPPSSRGQIHFLHGDCAVWSGSAWSFPRTCQHGNYAIPAVWLDRSRLHRLNLHCLSCGQKQPFRYPGLENVCSVCRLNRGSHSHECIPVHFPHGNAHVDQTKNRQFGSYQSVTNSRQSHRTVIRDRYLYRHSMNFHFSVRA